MINSVKPNHSNYIYIIEQGFVTNKLSINSTMRALWLVCLLNLACLLVKLAFNKQLGKSDTFNFRLNPNINK